MSNATSRVNKMDELSVFTKRHEDFSSKPLLNGVSNCNLIYFRFNLFAVPAFDQLHVIHSPRRLRPVDSTCLHDIKQILSLFQQRIYVKLIRASFKGSHPKVLLLYVESYRSALG